jgi:antitoxin ParD1/3/4
MNTTLNISLPETLTSYINQRIAEEHFNNASDYVRTLIYAEQQRREEQKLEQQLLEGLNSPAAIIAGSQEWDDFWENLTRNTQAA